MVARVAGINELAEWIARTAAQGGDRFELWQKQRGHDSAHVHTAEQKEPFDVADELLTHVERDARADYGQVSYAVYAYRSSEEAPFERAFVSADHRAMTPYLGAGAAMPGADPSAGPALALSSVLMSFQQMTQESFATLQRENESQRRTNETMVRASTGHFETLAKSYERTFGDLQQRYDAALRENSVLRAEIEKLKDDTKQITRMYDEVHDLKIGQSEWHQRKLKIADQLVALAPLLVAKAAKIPIDTGAVGVPGLDAFLESLDRRQIEAILSVLTPIQQGFIVQLLNVQAAKSAQASNEQGPAAAAAAAAAGGAKAPGTSSSAEQGVTG